MHTAHAFQFSQTDLEIRNEQILKASGIRRVTQRAPLPGRVVRRMLDFCDNCISYPTTPLTVPVRGGFGFFEIRNCRELIQRNIYFLGYYEFRETRLIKRYLRRGDLFIDVGANIGWFAVLASHIVGPNGKVIAFEPSAEIYSHLEKNVQLNSANNITLERTALADKNGSATLSGISERNGGKGSIMGMVQENDGIGEEVPTLRFDDYAARERIGHVRIMKIDVEGAEMVCLQGAKEFLKRRGADYLVIEINDARLRENGSSSVEVINCLRACGYRLFQISSFGTKPLERHEQISFANLFAVAS
jgi:FkbM family methyltransferase